MKIFETMKGLLYSCVVGFILTACSDDGIDGTGLTEIYVGGTAAMGAPIANSTITIKGSEGNKVNGTTNSDGSFLIDVTDLSAPYLLKIEQPNASILYSVATNEGTINIHPFTDLITRNWFQVRGYSVETEFNKPQAASILPSSNDIALIETTIKQIVNLGLKEFNLDATYELFTGAFDANGTGFDEFLDNMEVKIRYNKIDVTLEDSITGFDAKFIDNININTDFTVPDTAAPSVPTDLLTIAANSNSILVAWNASTDNIGVAGYNIYRNNIEIATSPYPLYSDTGLPANALPYCYRVEAFDGTGNVSAKTTESCATLLVAVDDVAPAAVISLTATPQGSTAIRLSWTPPIDNDVLAYDIYSGTKLNVNTKIATTVASTYLDTNPIVSTDTCYTVLAFDAARNTYQATVDDEVCAGTVLDVNAPTTTANPPGGMYTTEQTVRLICDDGPYDSGCSTTYFTLDGSVPSVPSATNATSIVYTGPITISNTTTLRFISIDNAGKVEVASNPANTQLYTIDAGGVGLLPGLEFSSTTFAVSEAGATAAITVRRNGDATTAASVDYRVTAGTATVDQDYTAVNGTLSWAAGDATSKTFFIPIKGDNVSDINETILLSLRNPVKTGFAINNTATLVIQDAPCNGVLDTSITVDTIIDEPCNIVSQYIQIYNNSTLTISPGVTFIFQANSGFDVREGSSLRANGTPTQPILFTSRSHTPGFWRGIEFSNSNDINNILNYVTVEYAGAKQGNANVRIYGTGSVSLTNSTLTHSSGFGFKSDFNSTINSFANNNFFANTLNPVEIAHNQVWKLDSKSNYNGNTLDSIHIYSGGYSEVVKTTQSWKALNVPYSTGLFAVGAFAANAANTTLTIEPGVTLQFELNSHLTINPNGTLVAQGTDVNPILLTANSTSPTTGFWKGITYDRTNTSNILEYVTIEYGGGGTYNANIYMTTLNTTLSMSNVTSRLSSGYGMRIHKNGIAYFPVFNDNRFTSNDRQPLRIPLRSVDTIDSTIQLTGNAPGMDEIVIERASLSSPVTWPKAEVHYSTSVIKLYSALTIEPGVEIRVRNDGTLGQIYIAPGGSLNAIGTSESPIIIRGAVSPSAGYWKGILFDYSNSANNVLQFVNITDAGVLGDATIGFGNIVLGPISQATIENCTISDSATHGIAVQSTANAATLKGDMNTNTFTNINNAGGYENIFYF